MDWDLFLEVLHNAPPSLKLLKLNYGDRKNHWKTVFDYLSERPNLTISTGQFKINKDGMVLNDAEHLTTINVSRIFSWESDQQKLQELLKSLFRGSPYVKTVNLENNNIKDIDLIDVFIVNDHLEELNISYNQDINPRRVIDFIAARGATLKTLELSDIDFEKSAKQAIVEAWKKTHNNSKRGLDF